MSAAAVSEETLQVDSINRKDTTFSEIDDAQYRESENDEALSKAYYGDSQ